MTEDMKNIILTDFERDTSWKFTKYLEHYTEEKWLQMGISNIYIMGKAGTFRRYIRYFTQAFYIFLNRGNFDKILSWQQFFGIILCVFLRFFHAKKRNKLYIMTFIFKPKEGGIGRLYYYFVRYAICSKYIEKIICFSSTEPHYYSELFQIPEDKFTYVPLGEDLNQTEIPINGYHKRSGVISVGLSNRDYEFLIDVFRELPYQLTIYSNEDRTISSNIVIKSERLHGKVAVLLQQCKLMAIPLEDKNISAGQLTLLHTMQMGCPVVASDSDGVRDFIVDGENGYLAENDVFLWRTKITEIIENKDIWTKMSEKTVALYNEKHTMRSMAKYISDLIR